MPKSNPPTVVCNGITYLLPFAALFRDLSETERAELVASLAELGPQCDVLTYDSPVHGPDCVIDGANRLRECERLGIAPRVQKLSVNDQTARRMAEDLNIARRQVSAEEAAAARRQHVVIARVEGGSLRAIAARLGVSEMQVRRDLNKAGATGGSHLTPPERVNGTDGKSYPAVRPHDLEAQQRGYTRTKRAPRAYDFGDGHDTHEKVAEIVRGAYARKLEKDFTSGMLFILLYQADEPTEKMGVLIERIIDSAQEGDRDGVWKVLQRHGLDLFQAIALALFPELYANDPLGTGLVDVERVGVERLKAFAERLGAQ